MGLHLHQLAHYRGIADALALIFAQLTAFIVLVATNLAAQETCHSGSAGRVQGTQSKAPGAIKSGALQPHASSSVPAQAAPHWPSVAAGGGPKPQTPFAQVLKAEGGAGAGADADCASIGISTLLSGMERQGSVFSSYLWQHKTGWSQAREMLRRELDASLGSYVSAGCATMHAAVYACWLSSQHPYATHVADSGPLRMHKPSATSGREEPVC
jgi:hypothetical protein